MATKHFCDRCKKEKTQKELNQLRLIEFSRVEDLCESGGQRILYPNCDDCPTDICHSCISEIIAHFQAFVGGFKPVPEWKRKMELAKPKTVELTEPV